MIERRSLAVVIVLGGLSAPAGAQLNDVTQTPNVANEGIKNRDLWYPTILGVLVVIAAVTLLGTQIQTVFNNIAIAAERLARSGARVAIVDWDVHHGNGTEVIFLDREEVLYTSLHQFPFYPGTG